MRKQRRLNAQERANIIAWTAEGVTAKEQAARLQMPYVNFCMVRQTMAKKGLVSITKAPPHRPWTKADLNQLAELLEQGTSYDEIARKMNRTRNAILIKCKRRHVRLLTVGGVYTAREVADLLGVPCSKTIARWIGLGWLPAANGGTEEKPLWRVQLQDIWAFMEREDCWMAWRPERITDPTLREWAQELRAGKPRWLTTAEVAKRFHVGHQAVNDWIHKGLLPSIKYGNHWVREDQLVGFLPPCDVREPVRCDCCDREWPDWKVRAGHYAQMGKRQRAA